VKVAVVALYVPAYWLKGGGQDAQWESQHAEFAPRTSLANGAR